MQPPQPMHPPSPPDFITKLHKMIKQHPQIISFSQDGTEVHIHNYELFVTRLLPATFRHNKWRSFIRQMNMYCFRKVNRGSKTCIFVNGLFRRGNQGQYFRIRRKVNTREEEIETQNHLEEELKGILALECQSIGIINNPILLQPPKLPPKPPTLTLTNPNPTTNPNPSHPNTIPTLPSLTTTPDNPTPPPYTNTILHFFQSILSQRKAIEQLCQDIKQNIEYIAKQRKTAENKVIIGNVKESIQLIEEMSGRFRDRMELFVDSKQGSFSINHDFNPDQYPQQIYQHHHLQPINYNTIAPRSMGINMGTNTSSNSGNYMGNNMGMNMSNNISNNMGMNMGMNVGNMGNMGMGMGINFAFNINSIQNYINSSILGFGDTSGGYYSHDPKTPLNPNPTPNNPHTIPTSPCPIITIPIQPPPPPPLKQPPQQPHPQQQQQQLNMSDSNPEPTPPANVNNANNKNQRKGSDNNSHNLNLNNENRLQLTSFCSFSSRNQI